jgi:thioredoxin
MKTFYALLSSIILLVACQNSNSQSTQVDAKTFAQLIETKKDAQLIDVRTPEEFQSGYINGSLNLDYNGADFKRQVASLDKSKPVLVYCLSGGRSASAARELRNNGFTEVIELKGGIMAWGRDNLPLAGATAKGEGMNESDFTKLISQSTLTLVDFHAPWCAPCKKMKPILEEIATENASLKIQKINVDENKNIATMKKVNVLPTLIIFKNGIEVWRHEGIISKEDLLKALNQ